jgi:hypothetical protein
MRAVEFPRNTLKPVTRRAAVGINIDEDVASGHAASGLACNHLPLPRFVHHPYTGDGRNRRCAIGAGIVNDDDFVWRERLLK